MPGPRVVWLIGWPWAGLLPRGRAQPGRRGVDRCCEFPGLLAVAGRDHRYELVCGSCDREIELPLIDLLLCEEGERPDEKEAPKRHFTSDLAQGLDGCLGASERIRSTLIPNGVGLKFYPGEFAHACNLGVKSPSWQA